MEEIMPNHYATEVTIKGSQTDIEGFLTKHIVKEKDPTQLEAEFFDFNTVVPMPEIIKGTESDSNVEAAIQFINTGDAPTIMKQWFDNPETMAKARQSIKAQEETGYSNWYEWSRPNWGTKWNSYNFRRLRGSAKRACFTFDTAWAPPIPVLAKLVKDYPSLTFSFRGRDEFERKWSDLNSVVGCCVM